jgi:hypothetical protein
LATRVIITLTPPCNDDKRLIVVDKGTNNTCVEVEGAAMVVTSDIIGACDAGTITNVAIVAIVIVNDASVANVASVTIIVSATNVVDLIDVANVVGALKVARDVGIVGRISTATKTNTLIPKTIRGVKKLKHCGTKNLCHTRNSM